MTALIRAELLELDSNERDIFLLAAGELGAQPVHEPPSRRPRRRA